MEAKSQSQSDEYEFPLKFVKLDCRLPRHCSYVGTATFVSYLIGLSKYWQAKSNKKRFYSTRKEQVEAIGYSLWQIEKSEQEAIEKGWIRKKIMGIPPRSYYIVNFQRLNEYFEGNVVTEIPSETRRKPIFRYCTLNKIQVTHPKLNSGTAPESVSGYVTPIYLKDAEIDIDAEELSGYEARESSSAVHSSGNSESRADEGIASLGATLPSPPVEGENYMRIHNIYYTNQNIMTNVALPDPTPEPLPDPVPEKPQMRFGSFDSLITYLKLRGSILACQVYPHLDPHKTLYEQGMLELTLCPAYPVNPRDFPLIAHKKQAAIDFRKSPAIQAFEEELKEILEQYGECWSVKIIKNIYEQGELNG